MSVPCGNATQLQCSMNGPLYCMRCGVAWKLNSIKLEMQWSCGDLRQKVIDKSVPQRHCVVVWTDLYVRLCFPSTMPWHILCSFPTSNMSKSSYIPNFMWFTICSCTYTLISEELHVMDPNCYHHPARPHAVDYLLWTWTSQLLSDTTGTQICCG